MKDKSIRDTAIITFTLIGGLFLLQKCSSDDVKIENRLYKEKDRENSHSKMLNSSYQNRDKEMDIASYRADDKNDTEDDSFTYTH